MDLVCDGGYCFVVCFALGWVLWRMVGTSGCGLVGGLSGGGLVVEQHGGASLHGCPGRISGKRLERFWSFARGLSPEETLLG